MNLGALMSRLENEGDAALALEALGDLPLFAAVTAMGAHHEETPGEYVANASRRFAARAGDEDWLAMMTAMERSADPGRTALERMLRWALALDEKAAIPGEGVSECSCGGGSGGCNGHG